MKVNYIATEGRLTVKVKPEEDKSAGGIFLARPTNPDLHEGTVLSVGEKLKDAKQEFKVGDKVVWSNYSGVEFENNGEKCILINQKDIIAIIEEVEE